MSIFLEYPEYAAAIMIGLFALVLLLKGAASNSQFHFPAWILNPAARVVGSLPAKYVNWLMQMQVFAGFRSNYACGNLAAAKIGLAFVACLSALVLPLPLPLLVVAGAFFIPDLVLWSLVKKRQQQIKESLPEALDLMVLCVDAGLGLDSTLQRIASERTTLAHCLNEELLTLGRDILLGMDRERAYAEMYKRTGVEELRSLGSSLNQSAKLGLSIAKILRTQSEFLRTKLSQKAEERAAKLPIFMAFPLWFCIMPALLVLLLAPSLIMFFQQLGWLH